MFLFFQLDRANDAAFIFPESHAKLIVLGHHVSTYYYLSYNFGWGILPLSGMKLTETNSKSVIMTSSQTAYVSINEMTEEE